MLEVCNKCIKYRVFGLENKCSECKKKKVLDLLISDKNKLNDQIDMVANLEIAPVTEDEWHQLCETPVRYNDILLDIAKETFPLGEDFVRNANDVSFKMNGFRVSVPTSRTKGVTIDVFWYEEKYLKDFISSNRYSKMREYFELLDSGNYKWYELAKCRNTMYNVSKFKLFLWWFFKAKWRKVDRDKWEKLFEEEDKKNKKGYKKHQKKQAEMIELVEKFHETVKILGTWAAVRYVDIFNNKN